MCPHQQKGDTVRGLREEAETQRMQICVKLTKSQASLMFLSARNEQEEQEEKREIKRRLTRKVSKSLVGTRG